jgi:predicted MFS family arabinose efflux permease
MRKYFTILMALMMVMMFVAAAYAGPIDWLADKFGYVPEMQLVAAQAETAKAITAAKEATESANQAAKAAQSAMTYGIIITAFMGGLVIFRKRVAKKILEEKPKKANPKEV